MTALLPSSCCFLFLLYCCVTSFCRQCEAFVLKANLHHCSDLIPRAVCLKAKDKNFAKDEEEAPNEGMSALEAKLAQLRAMTDRIETNLEDEDTDSSDENDTGALPVDEALARLEQVRLEGEAMDRELIRGMVGEDEDGLDTEERTALEEGIESLSVESRRARLVSLIANNDSAMTNDSLLPSPALARLQSRLDAIQNEARKTETAASSPEPTEVDARSRLQQKLQFLGEQAQLVTKRSIGLNRLQERWNRVQAQASAIGLESSETLSPRQASKDAQNRLLTKEKQIQMEASEFYDEFQSAALQKALDALETKETEQEFEESTLELGTLFSEKFSTSKKEKIKALFEVNQTLFFEDLHALENEAVRLEGSIASMELEKWHTLDEISRVDDNILVLTLQEKDFSPESSPRTDEDSDTLLTRMSPIKDPSSDGDVDTEGRQAQTTVIEKETNEEPLVPEMLDASLDKETVEGLVAAAEDLTNTLHELEVDSKAQIDRALQHEEKESSRDSEPSKMETSTPNDIENESESASIREPGRYRSRFEPAVSSVDSWMRRGSIMEDSGNHFSVW